MNERSSIAVLVALLAACEGPTGIQVRIAVDGLRVPDDLRRIRLHIESESTADGGIDAGVLPSHDWDIELSPLDGDPPVLPLAVGVAPDDTLPVDRIVHIVAIGETTAGSGCVLEDVEWVRPFARGRIQEADLVLTERCCGVTCPDGQSCIRGTCLFDDGSATPCVGGSLEACDSRDNDCDERIDEGPRICGRGVCQTVLETSSACGPCTERDPQYSLCGTGVDADCDGSIEEGPQIAVYLDVDRDGYGDSNAPAQRCNVEDGYSLAGGDCHDGDATINPGAMDTCNGRDDDCTGGSDSSFECVQSSVGPCPTSCGTTGTRRCNVGCTWDACVPPGEFCNGVDDNCNGQTDEGLSGCGTAIEGRTFSLVGSTQYIEVTVPKPGLAYAVPLVSFDSVDCNGDRDFAYFAEPVDRGSYYMFALGSEWGNSGSRVSGRVMVLGIDGNGAASIGSRLTITNGLPSPSTTVSVGGSGRIEPLPNLWLHETNTDDDMAFDLSIGGSFTFSGVVYDGNSTSRVVTTPSVVRFPPALTYVQSRTAGVAIGGSTTMSWAGVGAQARYVPIVFFERYNPNGFDFEVWSVACGPSGSNYNCTVNAPGGGGGDMRFRVLLLAGNFPVNIY